MLKRIPKQSGVALISVILITALITSMTVAMAVSQTYSIQKARNIMTKDRVALLLDEAEQQAVAKIIERRKLGNKDEQTFIDEDNRIVISEDGWQANAHLKSVNAKFNLNNLDAAFGAGAVRSASSAGRPQSDVTSGSSGSAVTPPDAGPRPVTQSSTGDNGGSAPRSPAQTPASPRLCNDTLNCAWWQYAPQGYVEEDAVTAETEGSGGVLDNGVTTRNSSAPASPQLVQQPQTIAESDPKQSGQANLGQVRLSPLELAEMRLVNLFRALDIDVNLVPALLDWIDEDSETRYPNGAEDDYYMNLSRPYRTANQRLTSLRELLLVKGFDRETYETLLPHLSILPRATNINVNTATQEVLMSLSPFIDSGTAEMIISARKIQPFQSVETFLEHPLIRGRFVHGAGLSVESDFYRLDANLRAGRHSIEASSYVFYTNLRATTVKRTIGYVQ